MVEVEVGAGAVVASGVEVGAMAVGKAVVEVEGWGAVGGEAEAGAG